VARSVDLSKSRGDVDGLLQQSLRTKIGPDLVNLLKDPELRRLLAMQATMEQFRRLFPGDVHMQRFTASMKWF
jgi:hypothetical protein